MSIAVGLVGFGYAGRVIHAPLIVASRMEIVGVVSRQHDAVRAAIPSAEVLADLEALLSLRRLDLVVIATPNDLHEPQALAAMAAGKHVVIDKPMALTVASADRLIGAAARSRVTLTVFHNRRWDSDFKSVARVIAAGSLGPIHTFEARWDRYRPKVPERWRESAAHGGGVLLDLGTHLLDQALALCGMPEWLQADLYSQRPGTSVDDAFELRMGRGRLRVTLGASSLAAAPGPRFRVLGDRGSFTSGGVDPQEDQLRSGMTPADDAFGLDPSAGAGCLVAGGSAEASAVPAERGRWRDFYGAVRSCIETGSAPPVSPADARRGLQLIEAAQRSSRSGARVLIG